MDSKDVPLAATSIGSLPKFEKDPHVDLKVIAGSSALPFYEPNVHVGQEYDDIERLVNKNNGDRGVDSNGIFWWLASALPLCIPVCSGISCCARLLDLRAKYTWWILLFSMDK